MTEAAATVFVVDDDASMRKSLRWLFQSVSLNVETYSSAAEFLAAHADSRSGCVVLDVRMPGMSGLELQDQLSKRGVNLPIIIVTGYGDVPMAVRAMKGGALDFIEKPFNDQDLLDRVRKAMDLDVRKRQEEAEVTDVASRLALLTRREREVMEFVAAGLPNKEIGERLNLSKKTVEVHRYHLMRKLGVSNVADLVRMAMAVRGEAQGGGPMIEG
jgi:two-component system, LuxR family, response regulator FixJ